MGNACAIGIALLKYVKHSVLASVWVKTVLGTALLKYVRHSVLGSVWVKTVLDTG